MKTTLIILAFALCLDALGWLMWALSGQHPVDSFYLGTITAHIIGLFA